MPFLHFVMPPRLLCTGIFKPAFLLPSRNRRNKENKKCFARPPAPGHSQLQMTLHLWPCHPTCSRCPFPLPSPSEGPKHESLQAANSTEEEEKATHHRCSPSPCSRKVSCPALGQTESSAAPALLPKCWGEPRRGPSVASRSGPAGTHSLRGLAVPWRRSLAGGGASSLPKGSPD